MNQEERQRPRTPTGKRASWLPGVRILLVILGVPLAVLFYQAHRSGLSIEQMFEHVFKPARQQQAADAAARGGKIDFLKPVPIGFPSKEPPRIGSLEIVDLDKDGLPDVLVEIGRAHV